MRRLVRRLPACLLLFWSVTFAAPTRAAEQPLEYQVKAAFLLNFTRFVNWPPTAFGTPDSMSICILGSDPFGEALNQIVNGELVNGRRVTIQRLKTLPGPKACQVIFFGDSGTDIRALPNLDREILTVGEGDRFVQEGGMIGFVLENRRVRFEINQTSAERAGLRLSAKLLNVAKLVRK